MSKRFTDTEKWKKPFVRSLEAPYKLLWFYILDDCDHAGIWVVDLEVAGIRIGEAFNEDDVLEKFGEKIQVIDGGEKWFVQDFIDFQYGTLNPENRVHQSVINLLTKGHIKPLISPIEGAKDKDKEKDKDKDKDIRGGKGEITKVGSHLFKNSIYADFDAFAEKFQAEAEAAIDVRYYFESVRDWSSSSNKRKTDWIATARNFMRKDESDGKLKKIGNQESYMNW